MTTSYISQDFYGIISGVVTSIIASIVFYFFNDYLPKRKKNKFLVEYISTQYWRVKISMLFEFSGILPNHTAWELKIRDPVNAVEVNFSDEENLYNYELLKKCFDKKLEEMDKNSDYKSPYIEDMAKRLLEMFNSLNTSEFIISNKKLFIYFTEISRFLFVWQDDSIKIIDEFIMGTRILTVAQFNNIIIPSSECGKDDFIDTLKKAYLNSLFLPFEIIIRSFELTINHLKSYSKRDSSEVKDKY